MSWQLPQTIADRLGEHSGRQRAMCADGHLLLVLHKVPTTVRDERQGVRFWRSPDGEWHSDDGRRGAAVVREHLQQYDQAMDEIEALYNRAASAREYFRVLELVAPLHRASANLHSALQSAREEMPDVKEIINFRDIAGDIERATELLHNDAKNALDFRIAEQAEQQALSANEIAKVGHRLNIMAALFLPASVIAGAFSTTLSSGLEGEAPWLFWAILFGSFAIGGLICLLLLKARRE